MITINNNIEKIIENSNKMIGNIKKIGTYTFLIFMLCSSIKKIEPDEVAFETIKINLYPGTYHGFYKIKSVGGFIFCSPIFDTYKVKSESKHLVDYYSILDDDHYDENKNLERCLEKANIKFDYVKPCETLTDRFFYLWFS